MSCMCRLLVLCYLCLVSSAVAQQSFGFRMAGDFNSFGSTSLPLVMSTYSNVNVGLYYTDVNKWGGYQLGLNFLHKDVRNGFNLPLIMRDFADAQNTSLSALELDLRMGPRFGWLLPQTGLVGGWRWKASGLAGPTSPSLPNQLYVAVPIGIRVRLPTGFGATGIGVHYLIGLTNFLRNPYDRTGWSGGSTRTLQVEIFVQFDRR
jgi:hypothetical protein